VAARGKITLLVYGRNNVGADAATATANILSSLAASVAYLTPYSKQYLVGLVLNYATGTEGIGSATYTKIQTVNNAIKAAYPNNYFDTQSAPTADEMAAIGFTPDSSDLAYIAADCIPRGMRSDAVNHTADYGHLNYYGYALWALRAKNTITSKGWL
jgi:hypothetical protein